MAFTPSSRRQDNSRSGADEASDLGTPPQVENERPARESRGNLASRLGSIQDDVAPGDPRALAMQAAGEVRAILGFVSRLVMQFPTAREGGEKVKQGLAEISQSIQTSLETSPANPVPPV